MWATHTCNGGYSGTLAVLQWPAWHKTAWLTITAHIKSRICSNMVFTLNQAYVLVRELGSCVYALQIRDYFATCGIMLLIISSFGLMSTAVIEGVFTSRTNAQACKAHSVLRERCYLQRGKIAWQLYALPLSNVAMKKYAHTNRLCLQAVTQPFIILCIYSLGLEMLISWDRVYFALELSQERF